MQSAEVSATFCATLVDEWLALGVRLAVVAPGSRSTPMAIAIADSALRTEIFHDERSAAFAALGAAKASGVPTVLLCTSGTAAVNFHPAVVEASYAEVPLIVVTADRPPELQGVGAPQTIDQRHLYGSSVRRFIDAGVADDERRDDWRRMARRAYESSTGESPGPVQVNIAFREPLVGSAGQIPARLDESTRRGAYRGARQLSTAQLAALAARLRGRRGLVVAGASGAAPPGIHALASRLGWPVVADPLGGARGESLHALRHADAMLRDTNVARALTPEVVLRFGALPASKVVNGFLRDCGAETIALTATPRLADPDRRVSMHIVANLDAAISDLLAIAAPCDAQWAAKWQAAESAARGVMEKLLQDESRLTEPGVARTIAASLPVGSQLFVSSSMPVRDLEWYAAATDHLHVMSNRGINGIDGVVSSAVGAALGTARTTALLIGDVAFLHDSNGLLRLASRGVDVRIVVVDNRGGGIFSFLPQRSTMPDERFEQLFGTPHEADLAALAAAHGIACEAASTTAQLRAALAQPGPRVIIVRTDRNENVTRHDEIHRAVAQEVRAAIG
jgi:2-succinyl-5-enolpyruvyl-6-hydroxy-3-cyclohexene-1-carboxylate synthase